MELVRYGIRVDSLTPTATDRAESYDRAERWGRHRLRVSLTTACEFRALPAAILIAGSRASDRSILSFLQYGRSEPYISGAD